MFSPIDSMSNNTREGDVGMVEVTKDKAAMESNHEGHKPHGTFSRFKDRCKTVAASLAILTTVATVTVSCGNNNDSPTNVPAEDGGCTTDGGCEAGAGGDGGSGGAIDAGTGGTTDSGTGGTTDGGAGGDGGVAGMDGGVGGMDGGVGGMDGGSGGMDGGSGGDGGSDGGFVPACSGVEPESVSTFSIPTGTESDPVGGYKFVFNGVGPMTMDVVCASDDSTVATDQVVGVNTEHVVEVPADHMRVRVYGTAKNAFHLVANVTVEESP
jgi:hypothetical protein